MPKSYYLPADDAGKGSWLNNLSAKLPSYFAALGLTQADVDSVTADAAFFKYLLAAQAQVTAYSQQWTAYKNAARNGTALGLLPVARNLGVAPAAVAPNIFGRATALVARIKVAPGYTDSIGQALQIVGADQTIDLTALMRGQPIVWFVVNDWGLPVATGAMTASAPGFWFSFIQRCSLLLALLDVPKRTRPEGSTHSLVRC